MAELIGLQTRASAVVKLSGPEERAHLRPPVIHLRRVEQVDPVLIGQSQKILSNLQQQSYIVHIKLKIRRTSLRVLQNRSEQAQMVSQELV